MLIVCLPIALDWETVIKKNVNALSMACGRPYIYTDEPGSSSFHFGPNSFPHHHVHATHTKYQIAIFKLEHFSSIFRYFVCNDFTPY